MLDSSGSGYMSNIAAAFAYAGRMGVRIVNASLGGPDSITVDNAIAAYPNTLYVVAAGNDVRRRRRRRRASFPCAAPAANMLCVGATDNQDNLRELLQLRRTPASTCSRRA